MLGQIVWSPEFIFYILAAEALLLCILQWRTNHLLGKGLKMGKQKNEKIKQLKEEIKTGESKIPVVKFEKQKKKEEKPKAEEKKSGFDEKEMAVLQEMLAEYFG